ncbi:MBL fold metallo-hydrolase [Neobacillus terrae]|uniref:MBL fold metallo-hydrolase n=1 Tax=Neobacillus terrae TaxID=3034837 RepID=UPI00140855EB|nr:MBL fold metallo-hydrolase [Neobacillus terrae]NHM33963.1 MBL fold metallo-hydrolase [Neobacillus terrae]
MKIQLIRHATHVISYNGKILLIDPMFSEKGTLASVPNSPREQMSNPLTVLPVEISSLLNADAIMLTHTHRDHFDDAAVESLPKHLPLFCQPEDEDFIKGKSFTNVIPISEVFNWEGIQLIRTTGEHGKGSLGKKMGPVSGFVLKSKDEPTLYIIGDSVWYEEIQAVFNNFSPDVAIIFAGEARFNEGEPITMGLKDIDSIVTEFPNTKLVISHLEAWNHCVLTRNQVLNYILSKNLQHKAAVPLDGESLTYQLPSE